MKFSILLLVGIIVAVSANCDYKGKTYKIGESFQPEGKCHIMVCDGVNSLSGKACGTESVADESKYIFVPEDSTKKFPDCCPKYIPKE